MRYPTRSIYLLAGIAAVFFTVGGVHAASSTVVASATILSDHQCTFDNKTPVPVVLSFGQLNPLSGSNVNALPATIIFSCSGNPNNPVSYGVTDDDGLHETGANGNRMKNTDNALTGASAYIPYEFTVNPTSGTTITNPKTDVTLHITGKVYFSDYRMAYEGAYEDTVFVFINP